MKVERWAVCLPSGTFVGGDFSSKRLAELFAEQNGGIAVLLTGDIPEPKPKKQIAQFVRESSTRHGRYYVSEYAVTKEESIEICNNLNVKLIKWPHGEIVEVEG